MSSLLCPPHLLLFDHPLTDHPVHCGLYKCGSDGFSIPVSLSIVGDECHIVADICAEFLHGLP